MKTNRAVGLDKIGARLLKDSVDVITPLTNLEIIVNFNKMLETLRGSVPKNGPIDFASKNHFSLNSADGKGLVPKY